MPYKVMNEDGKFKVYKLGADNKPTGKPLGTHGNKAAASAQVRALYANEKKEIETTEDVEGKALEELHQKMGYYDEPAIVIGGPTSFADLMAQHAAQEAAHEVHELTYHFSDLARNIMAAEIEDKGAALEALAGEYISLVQEKLTMEDDDKSLSVAKQIAGDNQPESKDTSTSQTTDQTPDSSNDPGGDSANKDTTQSLFIWKENDTYRWLAAYSNNRRDSDNPPEIISSQSHKEFDEALHKEEWPMPELWLWHIPYPVGVTQYHAYDESAGFPVAAGVFNKGFEWAAEGILEAGWNGVSHGMPSQWIERDAEDNSVITRHRTKEITFLPPWAAANKLAFNIISKEQEMADEKGLPAHKREEFIKAFGEAQVTQIEAALEGKAKEADEAGIEKKETAEDTPKETLTPDNPVVKALEMVVTQLTALDARLKEIEDKTSKVEEQLVKEEPFDLMEFLKSKSAVGQATTKVDGRSALAKDAPEEAKAESFTEKFSGIRVGLVDEFVGANQQYYNSRR